MKTKINTLARIVIAAIFIATGMYRIMPMESFGADFYATAASVVELAGGTILLLGYKPKFVVSALISFVILSLASVQLPLILGAENWMEYLPQIFNSVMTICALVMLLIHGAGQSFSLPLTCKVDDISIYNVKL